MAKLDLKKLLTKKGWKLTDLAKATGISQTVLRMVQDQVFDPTDHEHRLILEACSKPDPPKPGAKPIEAQAGQGDLFGGAS